MFKVTSWIQGSTPLKLNANKKKKQYIVYIFGANKSRKYFEVIEKEALDWEVEGLLLKAKEKPQVSFVGKSGPVWILRSQENKLKHHEGTIEESSYAYYRDYMGSLVNCITMQSMEEVVLHFVDLTREEALGVLVGMDIAAYRFKKYESEGLSQKNFLPIIKWTYSGEGAMPLEEAVILASSVNASRHLVNLPPNKLNPESFSQFVRKLFSSMKNVKVSVWDEARLKKEKMELHLAVGQGALTPPCLVHISYRPLQKKKNSPIAFVGKGITFDTGGLDLKPSSAMRLMKKDMGGAAAIVGLALWAVHSEYGRSLDFYIPLAENSVDKGSMRPSDIYVARNGLSVEIDNTDAEGRLVLADALDVALDGRVSEKPAFIVDLATLTGAIKVGLGSEIAGLFSNNAVLSQALFEAGVRRGEPSWPMPLYEKYEKSLGSSFADCRNSADGFGGAITAALFLKKFVKDTPWAHLDIYSWVDSEKNAYLEGGGNGQPVQSLAFFLEKMEKI